MCSVSTTGWGSTVYTLQSLHFNAMYALRMWVAKQATMRREVLVMVMRKHQRYFPVYSQHGEELMPYFITVANGAIHPPTVISGVTLLTASQPYQPSDGAFRKLLKSSYRLLVSSLLSSNERPQTDTICHAEESSLGCHKLWSIGA